MCMKAQKTLPLGNGDEQQGGFKTDSVEVEDVPVGIYAWTVDARFGDVRPAQYDTVPHLFQNRAFTDGVTGRYNFLGNLGSPRQSRIFTDRRASTFNDGQFLFATPYDFFLTQPGELLFTNTKSPFTNITYHECGNKQNGEDRIRALFSTNVNKRVGLGFKLDYLYGRGYYDSQQTSQFNGTLFGSYIGDRYQLHAFFAGNHLKTAENGGLENDEYVDSPESFSTNYGTADMPTNLTSTYNKLYLNTLFITHRYNLGFTRFRDENGNVVRIAADKGASRFVASAATDSALTDSMRLVQAADSGKKYTPEFVPTMSFFHTLRLDQNNRRFLSNATRTMAEGYFADFYLPGDSANDVTRYLHVDNTVGLELREGLNSWLKTGLRLFARHEFYRYTLPTLETLRRSTSYSENYVSLGAQLLRDKGRTWRYHALGEVRTSGKKWGHFNLEGDMSIGFPLLRDSLHVSLDAYARRELPGFYLRHYHADNAWWDNNLDQEFRIRAGGEVRYRDTRLSFHIENIRNLAYLYETATPYTATDDLRRARYGVGVRQASGSVQLIEASLAQKLRWGILNWEAEATFQATSDRDVCPLPAFNLWTNLYIKFAIAKVLHTELGADLRYFTRYYAPAYSPIIGQYAVQDTEERLKIGNYPTINVYANFHLKRTRFYVMASHVNHSRGTGCPYLVPHYPLNRLVLRLGLSWNFIN